jgi:hypothetical protein
MPAFVATLGTGAYRHTFGGSRWTAMYEGTAASGVQTILTLDLDDPRVERIADVKELPLCSHLWMCSLDRQSYRFDPDTRTVLLDEAPWELGSEEDQRMPLPSRALQLREATKEELEPHDDAIETFIGGPAFLRVGGEPLWLGDAEEVPCSCGRAAVFMTGVGYENIVTRRGSSTRRHRSFSASWRSISSHVDRVSA